MIKKRTARMISLATVVVVVAMLVGFFAITIGASAAPAPGGTNIVQMPGSTAGPYFHPKTLSCQHPCSITIKNTLASTQSITSNGKVLFTLGPRLSTSISFKQGGTYVYGLTSSSTHQLTVTVS
jgi:hypothetical protein